MQQRTAGGLHGSRLVSVTSNRKSVFVNQFQENFKFGNFGSGEFEGRAEFWSLDCAENCKNRVGPAKTYTDNKT